MKLLSQGTLLVGGAWNGGELPAPTPEVHRYASREGTGLVVALCGLRQEHRSNGWGLYRPEEVPHQRAFLRCQRCDELSGERHGEKVRPCEDCGDPGVSWEDGVILCDDCAILRAKKWQMERERRRER